MAPDPTPPPQLALFDLPQPPKRPGVSTRNAVTAVDAATHSDSLVRLGASLPESVRLGTSSWSFSGWRGIVYADRAYTEAKLSRDGLAAYAAHPLLRTVSVDRTFYAPLAEAEFARYAQAVPRNFRFMVKAPQDMTSAFQRDDAGTFTTSDLFLDAAYTTDAFIAPCVAGLSETLGVMVFQFPPLGRAALQSPDEFINRLYRFLDALPPALPYAVEVRDPELLTARFFKCLQITGASFCIASHARMPSPTAQLAALNHHIPLEEQQGPLVARWSLHAGQKYESAKERYAPFNRLVDEDLDSRAALAVAAIEATRRGRPTLIAINNKAEGSAPLSVEKLALLIQQQLQS
jgi:uncharacterized protein YecE (DUF72 family)